MGKTCELHEIFLTVFNLEIDFPIGCADRVGERSPPRPMEIESRPQMEKTMSATLSTATLEAKPPTELRILLAEDCVFNQKLVGHLLKKDGHHVEIVSDGVQAANASRDNDYDVILMDIEMPRMNGFEATEQIRDAERTTGHHVPILAMTAHEADSIRDQCAASGIDNIVTKPVNATELRDVLQAIGTPDTTPRLIDEADVLERVANDLDDLQDLIDVFKESSPSYLNAICDSIREQDCDAVAQSAHALKGQVTFFTDSKPFAALQQIESSAHDGQCDAAETAFQELLGCWPAFTNELNGLPVPVV